MKPWCQASWPILMSGEDKLAVKFLPKDFRTWRGALVLKPDIIHINAVWEDIEIRNFLIEFIYIHLIENMEIDDKSSKQDLYIRTLSMLSVDMYVDLDIIRKILEKKKLAKFIKGKPRKNLFSKIGRIRNWIKIHRDKSDFYQILGSSWSTFNSGTDIRLDVSKKNGKEFEKIVLTPQQDAKHMADFLTEIFK